jgi:hypothetical protein
LIGTAASGPTSFSWNTAGYASGNHTLQSVAYDAAGNAGQSTAVTVSVQNAASTADLTAPTVKITSPPNGATLARTQKIYVTASDDRQVVKVDLYIDGKFYATSTSATSIFTWNSNKAGRGQHTLQAFAYDAAGNRGASAVVTVTR